MKFAKELKNTLVPEWRDSYFDYKQGKKKIKNLQKAYDKALSPRTGSSKLRPQVKPDIRRAFTVSGEPSDDYHNGHSILQHQTSRSGTSNPIAISRSGERAPLSTKQSANSNNAARLETNYGSIKPSPPSQELHKQITHQSHASTLNLPEPALEPRDEMAQLSTSEPHGAPPWEEQRQSQAQSSSLVESGNAFEIGKTKHPLPARQHPLRRHTSSAAHSIRQRKTLRLHASGRSQSRSLLRRVFRPSFQDMSPSLQEYADIPLHARSEIDLRDAEFWEFMTKELDKIDVFYREKEQEATDRLDVLKEQLHLFNTQRHPDHKVNEEQVGKQHYEHDLSSGYDQGFQKIKNRIQKLPNAFHFGTHSLDASEQGTVINPFSVLPSEAMNPGRDYTRRAEHHQVRHGDAKRKLRAALLEFYRGLELLKSYSLLNHSAFRKITKKYDKYMLSNVASQYFKEKVEHANFVQSSTVEDYLKTTEDLYAHYLEKGSRKNAVTKLKKAVIKSGDYDFAVFLSGLFFATGSVLALEGLKNAAENFYNGDTLLALYTSYLLQFYAAYFLILLLMAFFCVDCVVFARKKINYVFVFELNQHNNLNWRQLPELPSFFLFLMGLFMRLNFSKQSDSDFYIWWPVVLIALSVSILFMPLPILQHKSRRWLLYSLGRLLCVPFASVEFRDFFLGDMLCSETYSMGGIELFFCTYAQQWNRLPSCNSSNSKLLGFLTTLPGIIRLLQCARRFYDTGEKFPHLANALKYGATIMQYLSLSIFRIYTSEATRALFITCGLINSMYCIFWDLVMDWSLFHMDSPILFLRPERAFGSKWTYYVPMITDFVLRFNWIFYAVPIFAGEIQHSALLGFLVSLSEVIRRGIWIIFRVENEHCHNVTMAKASREKPLPYQITSGELEDQGRQPLSTGDSITDSQSAQDIPKPVRTPSTKARIGARLHLSHAQDYQRKNEPNRDASDSDDDDEEDAEAKIEQEEIDEAASYVQR